MTDLKAQTVPVNVKDRDVFHITIEEYLLALTNTIEELVSAPPYSPFRFSNNIESSGADPERILNIRLDLRLTR